MKSATSYHSSNSGEYGVVKVVPMLTNFDGLPLNFNRQADDPSGSESGHKLHKIAIRFQSPAILAIEISSAELFPSRPDWDTVMTYWSELLLQTKA